jgi:hypothetical protein
LLQVHTHRLVGMLVDDRVKLVQSCIIKLYVVAVCHMALSRHVYSCPIYQESAQTCCDLLLHGRTAACLRESSAHAACITPNKAPHILRAYRATPDADSDTGSTPGTEHGSNKHQLAQQPTSAGRPYVSTRELLQNIRRTPLSWQPIASFSTRLPVGHQLGARLVGHCMSLAVGTWATIP